MGYILTFSNVHKILFGGGVTSDTASVVIPGAVTVKNNSIVLAAVATGNSANIPGAHDMTSPDTLDERADLSHASRVSITTASGVKTTAGATGDYAATLSVITPWAGRVLVLEAEDLGDFGSGSVLLNEGFGYSDGTLTGKGDWGSGLYAAHPSLSVSGGQLIHGGPIGTGKSNVTTTATYNNGDYHITLGTLDATEPFTMWICARRWGEAPVNGIDGYGLYAMPTWMALYSVVNDVWELKGELNNPGIIAGSKVGIRKSDEKLSIWLDDGSGWLKIADSTSTDHSPGRIALWTEGLWTADNLILSTIGTLSQGQTSLTTSVEIDGESSAFVNFQAEFDLHADLTAEGEAQLDVGGIIEGAAALTADVDTDGDLTAAVLLSAPMTLDTTLEADGDTVSDAPGALHEGEASLTADVEIDGQIVATIDWTDDELSLDVSMIADGESIVGPDPLPTEPPPPLPPLVPIEVDVGPGPRVVVVVDGVLCTNLQDLADQVYGDASLWKPIAIANGIEHPSNIPGHLVNLIIPDLELVGTEED